MPKAPAIATPLPNKGLLPPTLLGAGYAVAGEVIPRGKSGHHRARTVGNPDPAKAAGKCRRNDTADGAATREPRTGKGEMVR
jgi:hypothetical protein